MEHSEDTQLAIDLMKAAMQLSELELRIQAKIRQKGHPILEEKAAIEQFYEHSIPTGYALRALGMRLDRAALILATE